MSMHLLLDQHLYLALYTAKPKAKDAGKRA